MSLQVVKICKNCGPLSIEQTWKVNNKLPGLRCKFCRSNQAIKYRKSSPEKHRQKDKRNKYLIRDVSLKSLICSTCKIDKDISEFSLHMINLKYPYCKPCKKNNYKNFVSKKPEKYLNMRRNISYKKYYGITLEQFNSMNEKQNGLCCICNKPQSYKRKDGSVTLHVDHCHKTAKIRGLLCYKCNVGLGNFYDSIELMQKAIEYLKNNQ